MAEPKIIQIIHVPSNEQHGGGMFALCDNGEILAGTLGYVNGSLSVEWAHVPTVEAAGERRE